MANGFEFRTSNVIGTPLYQWVINQIAERSVQNSNKERDNDNLVYLANKTAWFRAISSIQLQSGQLFEEFKRLYSIQDENDLAKKFVLFAGTSAYKSENQGFTYSTAENGYENFIKKDADSSNYEEVQNYGYRPLPGITSVQIDTQGKLGSIRSAVINFKVWDKQQLDIIDSLYFKLGYTIFLEWGNTYYYKANDNSLYKSEDLSIDPFSKTINTKEEINLQIAKNVRKSEGNYDAMLGIITNFNFSFNQEGGYDCSLTVQALGTLGDSIKINHPSKLPNLYIKEITKYVQSEYQERINLKNQRIALELANRTKDLRDQENAILLKYDTSNPATALVNLLANYQKLSLSDIAGKLNAPSDMRQDVVGALSADRQAINTRTQRYVDKNTIPSSRNAFIGLDVETSKDVIYFNKDESRIYLDAKESVTLKLDSSYIFSIYERIISNKNGELASLRQPPVKNIFEYLARYTETNQLGYTSNETSFDLQVSISGNKDITNLNLYKEFDPLFYLDSIEYNPGNLKTSITLSLVSDPNEKIVITDPGLIIPESVQYNRSVYPDKTLSNSLVKGIFDREKTSSINDLNAKIAEVQKQIESEFASESIQSADLDYLSQQANDAKNYQSALEIMLKSIEIRSLSQAQKIDTQKTPVTVDLTKKDSTYKDGFLSDLFSEGIFKGILNRLISEQNIPIPDEEYDKVQNKSTRFFYQAKYGFNHNLLSGTPPSLIPLVDYKDLFKSYVLPYEINTEIEQGISAQHPVYIPLGLLVMMINNICLLYDTDDANDSPTPLVYLDYNPNTNFCLSNAKQFSTDITKFIIPFQGSNLDYYDLFDPEILDRKTGKIKDKDYTVFRPDNAEDFLIKKIPDFRYYVPDASAYQGRLMYALVNVNYAAEIVKRFSYADGTNSVYLKQLLETILLDLNKSLGNFNMFRLSYHDPSNCFVIVDDQQAPTEKNEQSYHVYSSSNTSQLPVFGKNSIARSIELRTNISNKLGSMLAISANSSVRKQVSLSTDASSLGYLNTDFKDRYVRSSLDIQQIGIEKKDSENTAQIEAAIKFDSHVKSIYTFYNTFSTNAIGSATNYYIQKMSVVKNRESGSFASAIIPVSLNISMDGISGIQMTQLFTVDDRFLPTNYLKKINDNPFTSVGFAVVGLSQVFENNQWITNVRTQMNYLKSGPNDFKSVLKTRQAAIEARRDLLNGKIESDKPAGIAYATGYPSQKTNEYSNILFGSGNLGNVYQDYLSGLINTNLLTDINSAASKAGITVVITTAVSNHPVTNSRHGVGNGVDIAIINGESVGQGNRATVEKFTDQLVLLGYALNREAGNDKAVLTYGFQDGNHETHVHVSNRL
jgi:hypothetical protein